jgi:hypothetical protein
MQRNQNFLRVQAGARRTEIFVYLALDSVVAISSFTFALGHGWSPYLFLLIIAVPATIMGLGMAVSLLLAGRAPRLTMDLGGITVDSDGRHWHCAWADVVWVGVVRDVAQLPGSPVLVAELGPEAPPVGKAINSPPASLPDTNRVVMIDLSMIIGDREEAIATARNISGTKWRA